MIRMLLARAVAVSGVAILSFLLSLSTYSATAHSAEIKVLSSVALHAVMEDLVPQFERATGHKLAIQFGAAAALKRRIDAGEVSDVAILTPPLIDELIKQGKIAPDTRADIARSGMGVAVRAGAPKPDISSVDAFKKALIAAKSIGYTDPALGGLSGVYTAGLLERLGIAAKMKPKTKLTSNAAHALAEAIARGEVEIGLIQMSEIVPEPGLQLVGPFPPELQNFSVFTAGVLANSKEPEAGRALIKFLVSPAALTVIRAKGM
jgi:molybdate transport system substrate-binding protein